MTHSSATKHRGRPRKATASLRNPRKNTCRSGKSKNNKGRCVKACKYGKSKSGTCYKACKNGTRNSKTKRCRKYTKSQIQAPWSV